MSNGKARDMDYKFAIKVLSSAKVDTPSIHGNPKKYGYQNQYFYDIARNMAIQALKEKYENDKPQANLSAVALETRKGMDQERENMAIEKIIDLTQTAQAIVETLEKCGFNDCTDSSGYYVIKYLDEFERSVDVYKSKADGKENDHYVVYCSYEDEQSDYVYTEDLSVESLEKVLRELADEDERRDSGGPRHGNWSRVEVRLPEEDVRVLVCVDSERSYTKIDTDRMLDDKWVRWGTDVTHWMPLPEPPSEKG